MASMAEPVGDEPPPDPFDAQASGREPFPPFEAALAAADAEGDGESSALNWSIDTLAELKPAQFSPLAEQKQETEVGTPHGASGFFDDEQQYSVLRTPVSARAPVAVKRSLLTPSPSPSNPMELHRRCRETIARCEARLRERQRKMDSLQAVLPPRTPKRSARDQSQWSWSSPPLRSAKRNKSSAFTPISERKSMPSKTPMWSASPVAVVKKDKKKTATPSPFNTPRDSTRLRTKQRLSFGLSPIMFSSPEQMQKQHSELFFESEEEEKQDKPQGPQPSKRDDETLPSATPVKLDKENDDQQQLDDVSASSHTASSSASMLTPDKSAAPSRSSIPSRQKVFMAAIEAEASTNRRSSGGSSSSSTRAAASAVPISSLYQEAKQLGISDPKAQWEFVQLLKANHSRKQSDDRASHISQNIHSL